MHWEVLCLEIRCGLVQFCEDSCIYTVILPLIVQEHALGGANVW
jgi:hypothetical protein